MRTHTAIIIAVVSLKIYAISGPAAPFSLRKNRENINATNPQFDLIFSPVIGIQHACRPRFDLAIRMKIPNPFYGKKITELNDVGVLILPMSVRGGSYKCQAFKRTGSELENRLNAFYAVLRTFVSGTVFELDAFDFFSVGLEKYFSHLATMFETSKVSPWLSQQYEFVAFGLSRMIDCLYLMRQISTQNAPGIRLMYKLVELQARTVALYSPKGRLEAPTQHYGPKVMRFLDSLHTWEARFERLPKVTPEVRLAFEVLALQVEQDLLHLKSFISSDMLIYGY